MLLKKKKTCTHWIIKLQPFSFSGLSNRLKMFLTCPQGSLRCRCFLPSDPALGSSRWQQLMRKVESWRLRSSAACATRENPSSISKQIAKRSSKHFQEFLLLLWKWEGGNHWAVPVKAVWNTQLVHKAENVAGAQQLLTGFVALFWALLFACLRLLLIEEIYTWVHKHILRQWELLSREYQEELPLW